MRRSAPFSAIATVATCDNIFPRCFATNGTGNDMIQIKLASFEALAAILAGVVIANQNIET